MPLAATLKWSEDPPLTPSLGLIKAVREARFSDQLACPRCRSPNVVRWGKFSRRQRYKCRHCRRTFSDFTATPLAYSKKPALWPAFAACMVECLSVRSAALRLRLDKDTTWRWRHALLAAHLRTGMGALAGTVELVLQRRAWCDKGARHLARPPRSRGQRCPQTQGDGVWIVIATDRSGQAAARVAGRRPTRQPIQELLARDCRRARVLLGRGQRLSPIALAARALNVEFRPVPACGLPENRRSSAHNINAVRYARAFWRWLERFRGVSSRYLQRYLHWFWILEPLLYRHTHLLLEAERAGR
ncbi:MAG TPA: IS1 family transposase [Longimicrobiales bacterium]